MKYMDLGSLSFAVEPAKLDIYCKKCGSKRIVWNGRYRKHHHQYMCKRCGSQGVFAGSYLFKMRKPAQAVGFAVELYASGGISYYTIARLLLQYFNVKVSHTAIFQWVQKGAQSPWIPKLEPAVSPKWHVDETLVRVNKEWMYLIVVWCPRNKLVLSWHLSRDRSCEDIVDVLHKAVDNAGFRPAEIVTDGWHAYEWAVKKVFGWRCVKHTVESGLGHNNPVERQNREIKRRVKWFSSFRTLEAAENFFTVFFFVRNFRKQCRMIGWLTPASAAGIQTRTVAELFSSYPP
jgi:transposase-like protein/predicted RNA-binding Zn-ribbon protein involved in translation (DUF1610 family)